MTVIATEGSRLLGALERPEDDPAALRIWTADGYATMSRAAWHDMARRMAAGLRAQDLEPGQRVAAVLTNTAEACALAPACWLAGHPLLSLPVPSRGQPFDAYLDLLRRIITDSRAAVLVVEGRLAAGLGQADIGVPVVAQEDLGRPGPFEATPLAADDIAFVQFSSGSTSSPKGCALALGAIDAHLDLVATHMGACTGCQMVCWVPLSHDMGFFGGMLPAFANGMTTAISTPERFIRSPRTWLEDMARFEADMSVSPNFGLTLLVRAVSRTPVEARVGDIQIMNGGERIQWETILRTEEVLGAHGLTRQQMAPGYGLAEATVIVSHTPRGHGGAHALWVDRAALAEGHVVDRDPGAEGALAVVGSGVPLGPVELSIRGDADVGRILMRTPTLATGYLDRPEETAAVFTADGLLTSDLGFMREGELYVVGRVDDVLVHGGRNVHARDVEEPANAVPGVRPGTAVLVDVEDGARTVLVMVVEAAPEAEGVLPELARELSEVTFRACGVHLERCVFMDKGTVPKTPSGKAQRFRARDLVRDGGASVAEVVTL